MSDIKSTSELHYAIDRMIIDLRHKSFESGSYNLGDDLASIKNRTQENSKSICELQNKDDHYKET